MVTFCLFCFQSISAFSWTTAAGQMKGIHWFSRALISSVFFSCPYRHSQISFRKKTLTLHFDQYLPKLLCNVENGRNQVHFVYWLFSEIIATKWPWIPNTGSVLQSGRCSQRLTLQCWIIMCQTLSIQTHAANLTPHFNSLPRGQNRRCEGSLTGSQMNHVR